MECSGLNPQCCSERASRAHLVRARVRAGVQTEVVGDPVGAGSATGEDVAVKEVEIAELRGGQADLLL